MISKYIKFSLPIAITLDFIIKTLTGIFFIFYVSGFLVWNAYLSQYGFFEYNLLQARYISAGLLFDIIVFFVFIIIIFLFDNFFLFFIFFNKRVRKPLVYYKLQSKKKIFFVTHPIITISIFSFFLGLCFYLFPYFIFPNIPQYFGGSKAIPASLIGNSYQMAYLSNYGIGLENNSGDKDSVQTKPVCILYQNQEYILIGILDWQENGNLISGSPRRIINLKKDQINGFQSKGGLVGHVKCSATYFYDL